MPEGDPRGRGPCRSDGLDVVLVALSDDRRAHQSADGGDVDDRHGNDHILQVRTEDGDETDADEDRRKGEDGVEEAADDHVDEPAEIPGGKTKRNRDRQRRGNRQNSHPERYPRSEENAGEDITPEIIEVEEGDTVSLHFTNQERAEDETHGFAIRGYPVQLSVEPGKTVSATIKADKPGVYPYYCTEFCSALHLEMQGYLLVRPKGTKAESAALKEGQAYSEEDFNKQVKTNNDTQAVIDSVVKFITERNFKDFPTAVALVEDATDQLNFAADAKKKCEDFAGKKDWPNATLWAQQWFQYQVKAADIGLRAKTYLEQQGAKTVK